MIFDAVMGDTIIITNIFCGDCPAQGQCVGTGHIGANEGLSVGNPFFCPVFIGHKDIDKKEK